MQIQHLDDGKKGLFYIDDNEQRLAEMSYVWAGDRIIIDHTEVAVSLEGKGIGKQLVRHAVEMAREKHIRILPLCPFAKRIIDKEIAFHDIL